MIIERLWTEATISVNEAASILDIGRSTAYEAVRNGEIETLKIGSRVLVLTAPLRHKLGLGTYNEYALACDGGSQLRRSFESIAPSAEGERPSSGRTVLASHAWQTQRGTEPGDYGDERNCYDPEYDEYDEYDESFADDGNTRDGLDDPFPE